MADPPNTVYVSAVSTWEIAIKPGGRLDFPGFLHSIFPIEYSAPA